MNATPVTKGLVVRQPWATLIALGVKTIETRPYPPNGPMRPEGVRGLPGLPLDRGERIAIVAGAKAPTLMERFGDLRVESTVDGAFALTNYGLTGPADLWHPLPLGAVVCTVTVEDALPMEPCPPRSTSFDDRWEPPSGGVVYLGGLDGGPWLFDANGHGPFNVSDQLPLGDFTEGRWGLMLGDPQPPTKRCHYCGSAPSGAGLPLACDVCDFTRRIPSDPIPCKGKQGVFTLPADVAEALS